MTEFRKLTPFKRCVLQNFPFIEEDFDSLTNYGLLCKVVEYLNRVINSQNEVTAKTEELTVAFNNLKNHVDTFFDTLDLQEEVNNKLDEMAESGQLADIVAEYIKLRGILAYNNVSEMKSATNLVDGSFVETYGFYSKGDGGGAKYKVREIINTDVVDETTLFALSQNNLVAELIYKDIMHATQFGLKSDGLTDTTEKLKIALEKCANKKLIFSDGVYLVGSKITLSDNDIKGNNTVFECASSFADNSMLKLENDNRIEGIRFNADNMINTFIEDSVRGKEEYVNCEFYGCNAVFDGAFPITSALYLTGKDTILNGCSIHNNKGHGVRLKSTQENSTASFINCKFNDNGDTGTTCCGFCEYDRTYGEKYLYCSVVGCEANNNTASGFAFHSISNIKCSNSIAKNNGEHGFVLMDGTGGSIINCSAINNEAFGIRVQGDYSKTDGDYKNFVINGNTIVGRGGILISHEIQDGIVSSNTITASGEERQGIRIGDDDKPTRYVKNCLITDNIIKGFSYGRAITTFIQYDDTVDIKNNYIDGKSVDGASIVNRNADRLLAGPLVYGSTNNIVVSPNNMSDTSVWSGGTAVGNVVTPNSGGVIRQQAIECNSPKFLTVAMDIAPYNKSISLGIRFRNSSNTLINFVDTSTTTTTNVIAWNKFVQGTSICKSIDLSKLQLTDTIAKVEVFVTTTSGNTDPVEIKGIYLAKSSKLPVIS